MHMRASTWPGTKRLGWLLPPAPALNVTKPSCCFQHSPLAEPKRIRLLSTAANDTAGSEGQLHGEAMGREMDPALLQHGGSSPATHLPILEPPAAPHPISPAWCCHGHISPSFPTLLSAFPHPFSACAGDVLPGSISFPVRSQSSAVRSHLVSKGSNKSRETKDKRHCHVIIRHQKTKVKCNTPGFMTFYGPSHRNPFSSTALWSLLLTMHCCQHSFIFLR